MAATLSAPVHGQFAIGRVFARAGAMARDRWGSMAIVLFLLTVLPSPIRLYAGQQFGLIVHNALIGHVLGPVLPYLLSRLVVLVFHGLCSAALIRLALAPEGARTDAASALLQTMRAAPRFIGLFLAIEIGSGVLALLLLVPGLIFEVSAWVAMPAAVVEGRGVRSAFKRSFDLTRGARWRIFAIHAVCWVAVMLLGQAVAVIRLETLPIETGLSAVGLVTDAILASVSTVAFSLLRAAAYVELTIWKEGAPSHQLRDIFD